MGRRTTELFIQPWPKSEVVVAVATEWLLNVHGILLFCLTFSMVVSNPEDVPDQLNADRPAPTHNENTPAENTPVTRVTVWWSSHHSHLSVLPHYLRPQLWYRWWGLHEHVYLHWSTQRQTNAHQVAGQSGHFQGNTLPLHMYHRIYLDKLDADGFLKPQFMSNQLTILRIYNDTKINQYGWTTRTFQPNHSVWSKADFYVEGSDGPAVLEMPTSRQLKLVNVHCAVTKPQCPPSTQLMRSSCSSIPTSLTKFATFQACTKSSSRMVSRPKLTS